MTDEGKDQRVCRSPDGMRSIRAAEPARNDVIAALEVHLDLTDQLITQTFA